MPGEFKIKNGVIVDAGGANISGSSAISGALAINASGSSVFTVDGTSGRLFSVDDSLSGSLFSVNTAAGLPIIEAFSDNTVRIGQYGQRALFVSQSRIGIGLENPTTLLHISGSTGGLLEIDSNVADNILYVSSSGNIGIGTNIPIYKLDVNGTSRISGDTLINSANGLTVTTTVSSTPAVLNAGGSATVALELQSLSARRFRIISTSATTTFEATNTSGFIMNSGLSVSGNVSATSFTGSLLGTASFATNASQAVTASYILNAVSASFAATAALAPNYVLTSATSSMSVLSASFAATAALAPNYVLNSVTSSMLAPYVTNNQTSSFVVNSQTSSFVTNSQTSSFVTNSQTSSMTVLSASFAATTSLAPNYVLNSATSSMLAPYVPNAQTSSFVINSQTSSFVTNTQTSSFVTNSQTSSFVANSQTSSMSVKSALTASYADNFIVAGTLTAQTIVVQTITSSIDFVTGSSRFGSIITNTHQFTGSVSISGSLAVNGSNVILSNQTSSFVINSQTSSFVLNSQTSSMSVLSASFASTTALAPAYVLNSATSSFVTNTQTSSFVANSQTSSMSVRSALTASSADTFIVRGNVGIGTTTPTSSLNVNQLAGTTKGIFISGDEIFASGNGATNKGIRIALGVSRTSNRQLWMGDNDAFGSTTLGVFRYQTGLAGYAALDSVTGDGLTRLLTIIGSDTSDVGVGYDALSPVTANYTGKLNSFVLDESKTNLYLKKFGSGDGNFIEAFDSANILRFRVDVNGNVSASTFIGTATTASYVLQAVSASNANLLDGLDSTIFATTGSNTFRGNQIVTGSLILSSSAAVELTIIGNEVITGSSTATLGYTGSLFGTASWASNAVTSSYILNAVSASFTSTASYVLQAVSASFASTASSVNILNQNVAISGGLTLITGSGIEFQVTSTGTKIGNVITDSHTVTGSINVSGSITSSLFGTASWATNALTASFVLGGSSTITIQDEGVSQGSAGTINFTGAGVTATVAAGTATVNIPGGGGASFPYTGSAIITGSLIVTGSTTSTLGFTGSLFGTSSWAIDIDGGTY